MTISCDGACFSSLPGFTTGRCMSSAAFPDTLPASAPLNQLFQLRLSLALSSMLGKVAGKVPPTNRGGEVGVEGRRQAVVVVLWGRHLPAAKVGRLRHATRRHDAHQLVEVGVLWALRQIQGLCQGLHTPQL